MDRLAAFAGAKNFVVYYGHGREDQLSSFDVAIVEPAGHGSTGLKEMQHSGTLVLAYLSVIEVPEWDPAFKMLKAEDFLLSPGRQPLINMEYGNYLADLGSKRWTGLIMHRAARLIANSGYDGLFLDTIGDVEWAGDGGSIRDSLLVAAADFVRQIRNLFPGRVLIQNQGLESLCLLTAPYLNGICWENPPLDNESIRQWVRNMIGQLSMFKERYGLKVLMLQEEKETPNRIAGEISCENGFLLYRAPRGYTTGINLPEEVQSFES